MSDDDKITFPVEASHIMMFSRSIGDFSADYDANAAAPPTYAQSVAQFNPDYFLRMKDDSRGSGQARTRVASTASRHHPAACTLSSILSMCVRFARAMC